MRLIYPFLFVILLQSCVSAQSKVLKDISYKMNASDEYEKERCKLDVYLTSSKEKTPVLVWFHGGSIQKGSKDKEDEVVDIAKVFADKGIAFVGVNYRLHPKVKFPTYIVDCAASIKWTVDNAEKYGFDKNKIFVGGHSAGGYLTMMTSFKNSYVKEAGLNIDDIAGFIPVSGQTITHSTVRKEMGISRSIVIVDDKSPLYHHTKIKTPMFLLAGDKDLKMRAEESQFLFSGIKGNAKGSKFEVFKDRDHVTIVTKMVEKNDPVFSAIVQFIKDIEKQ